MNCSECQKQFLYTTCSELVVIMYKTGKSMNNLLSYYGLIDARIRPSNKDLPVMGYFCFLTRPMPNAYNLFTKHVLPMFCKNKSF